MREEDYMRKINGEVYYLGCEDILDECLDLLDEKYDLENIDVEISRFVLVDVHGEGVSRKVHVIYEGNMEYPPVKLKFLESRDLGLFASVNFVIGEFYTLKRLSTGEPFRRFPCPPSLDEWFGDITMLDSEIGSYLAVLHACHLFRYVQYRERNPKYSNDYFCYTRIRDLLYRYGTSMQKLNREAIDLIRPKIEAFTKEVWDLSQTYRKHDNTKEKRKPMRKTFRELIKTIRMINLKEYDYDSYIESVKRSL